MPAASHAGRGGVKNAIHLLQRAGLSASDRAQQPKDERRDHCVARLHFSLDDAATALVGSARSRVRQ
jgi:hypothetical protein